jgi:hypothetical protein
VGWGNDARQNVRSLQIPLTNFRGIELRDFPAEIARLALIIAEYQCDVSISFISLPGMVVDVTFETASR